MQEFIKNNEESTVKQVIDKFRESSKKFPDAEKIQGTEIVEGKVITGKQVAMKNFNKWSE